MQPDTPRATFQNPENECTHTIPIAHDLSPQTQERRSLTLHLQRGSHATTQIRGKIGPKCSQCCSTLARMLRLPPQKERHPPSVLRFLLSNKSHLLRMILSTKVKKKVRAPAAFRMEPEVGNCSPTKPLMTVDFPAPFVLTTATRLTCNTVRFTSTIVGLSFEGYWKFTRIMRKFAALHVLKETRLHEGELHQPVAKYALSPGTSHEHGEHVAREGLEPVLQPLRCNPRPSDQWAQYA